MTPELPSYSYASFILNNSRMYSSPTTSYSYYGYRTLNVKYIRLLDLLSGEPGSLLYSRLRHVLLNTHSQYEALSYTWGDAATSQLLRVDEHVLRITSNLANALQKLRRVDMPRTLWIDQVCINQNSAEERSEQVTLMAAIYSLAVKVVI